ncbi:MAG TPA: Hpt domain-containing protein, partial [Burkholderiaceae bacterium]|nr:Hpt domain-containing protein [Burkholderiaceae bacterium]
DGKRLADGLQATVTETQHVAGAPPAALAMEVATSLLYLDASLEDGDFDNPHQGERVRRLAERVAAVRAGHAPEPLEGWMEELYRRVSDRQTLGSVVHELRASLSESEGQIDQYFRNPADTQALMPVPAQLSAMRGVLSVLGLDQASQAVLRMRDDIDALLTTEVDPVRASQTGTFDRLAGNLGALGFLIDMFSVQPQMAKSLFAFDAARGTLDPLMGRPQAAVVVGEPATPAVEPRLLEQAQSLAFSSARADVPMADLARDLELLSGEARASEHAELVATVENAQSALESAQDEAEIAAARAQLSEALVDFVHTNSGLAPLEPELPAPRVAPPTPADGPEQDDEMRAIFLEEAHEVLADARAALAALADAPGDLECLTGLRRAFHTLKGSSRMVGLNEFGAAAWACEQVYNTRLAEQRPADAPLLAFTETALAELGPWVQALADGSSIDGFAASRLQSAAEAMAAPPVTILPAWSETTTDATSDIVAEPMRAARPQPSVLPPDLPQAQELEFRLDLDSPESMVQASSVAPVAPEVPVVPMPSGDAVQASAGEPEALGFELDLRALDVAEAPTAASAAAEPAQPFDMFATMPYPRGALEEPPELPVPEVVDELVELTSATVEVEAPQASDAAPPEPLPDDTAQEQEKRIGDLRISIPLFNIYLNEADELSRRLGTTLAEWELELHRPIGEDAAALAHSLAGSSATVGFADLSQLARALEHALLRAQTRSHGEAAEARLYVEVADEIRSLLHQFAAGFLKSPRPGLLERLAETEIEGDRRRQEEEAADAAATAIVDAEPAIASVTVDELPTAPAPLSDHGELASADSRFGGFGMTQLKPLADLVEPVPGAGAGAREALDEGDETIDAIDAVDAEL